MVMEHASVDYKCTKVSSCTFIGEKIIEKIKVKEDEEEDEGEAGEVEEVGEDEEVQEDGGMSTCCDNQCTVL